MKSSMTTDRGLLDLLKSGGLVLAFKVLGAAGGLIFSYILSLRYGADGLGRFEFAFAWLIILALFSKVGLDTAVLKIIPDQGERFDENRTRSAIQRARNLIVLIGLTFSILLFLLSEEMEMLFGMPGVSPSLRFISFLILPLSLLQFQGEIFRARHYSLGFSLMQNGVIIGLSCVPLLFIPSHYGVIQAFAAIAVSLGILSVFSIVRNIRSSNHWWLDTRRKAALDYRDLLRIALPLMVYSGMYFILSWTDSLMTAYFLDDRSLGIYRISFKLTTIIGFVAFATNGVGAPHFSRLSSKGDKEGLRTYVNRIVRINALIGGLLTIALLIAHKWLLGIFGEEFIEGQMLVIVFSLGQLLFTILAPGMQLLSMCGHERIAQNVMIVWAALNFLLNLLLIPALGLLGAAIATSVTLIGWNIAGLLLVRSRVGFWMNPF